MAKPVFTVRRACVRVQAVVPLVSLVLAWSASQVSAQSLAFVEQAGGVGEDRAVDVAVDAEGSRYVTGSYEAGARFGGEAAAPLGVLENAEDVFVAKYDVRGALAWVRSAGGVGRDQARAVAVDALGNSVVVGTFEGVASFGGGEPRFTQLVATPLGELFVAKYGPDGALLWAKQTAGSNSRPIGDEAADVALDAAGNVYVTGTFNGSSIFGFGEPNRTTLSSTRLEVFLAKYAPDGQLVWARQARGTVDDVATSLAVDAAGHAYVTGYFRDRVTFGAGEPGETTLETRGVEELFVAKYDAAGALVWARRGVGEVGSSAQGAAVAVDGEGGVVVGGTFLGMLAFGSAVAEGLQGGGSFLVRYDALGTPLWSRGIFSDAGLLRSVAVDGRGEVHVVGTFSAQADFLAGDAVVTLTPHAGADGSARSDGFLARYAADGALRWALGVGGTGDARFDAVAADAAGRSHLAGSFSGNVALDDDTPVSAGGDDALLATYEDVGPLTRALRVRALVSRETLEGVRVEQSRLVLDNGENGIRTLGVIVNGRSYWLTPLRNGRRYTLDLSRDLQPGDANVIVLWAIGGFGARATLTLGPE